MKDKLTKHIHEMCMGLCVFNALKVCRITAAKDGMFVIELVDNSVHKFFSVTVREQGIKRPQV